MNAILSLWPACDMMTLIAGDSVMTRTDERVILLGYEKQRDDDNKLESDMLNLKDRVKYREQLNLLKKPILTKESWNAILLYKGTSTDDKPEILSVAPQALKPIPVQ